MFDNITRMDQEATLHFRNSKGLHLKDGCGSVNALLINGTPTTGRIEDDTLIIPLPEGERWVIEFANTDYYEVNLYNAENIPAVPFAVALEME